MNGTNFNSVFGFLKSGDTFDKVCEQTKGNRETLLPRLNTSSIKYDFRSEWMRNLNGKINGDDIKMGDLLTEITSVVDLIIFV